MEVSYCFKCKKVVKEDVHECECEGRSFIYGEEGAFDFDGDTVVCKCGNKSFKNTLHVDYDNRAVDNYNCTNCNNAIGLVYYRKADDFVGELI